MSIRFSGLVAIMLLSGDSLAEAVRTTAGRVVDAYTGRAIAAGRVWIKGTDIADKIRPDVLKGAAASGMYGSKGSNGVVVITTKRGRRGGAGRRLPDEVG